jgi:hypothetical protein
MRGAGSGRRSSCLGIHPHRLPGFATSPWYRLTGSPETPAQQVIAPANLDKSDAVASAEIVASAEEWELTPRPTSPRTHDYTGAAASSFLLWPSTARTAFSSTRPVNFRTAGERLHPARSSTALRADLDADVVANDRDFGGRPAPRACPGGAVR